MQLELDISDWRDITTVPKDASFFDAKMKNGKIYRQVHWASDLSGEYQPAFQGFFIEAKFSDGRKYFRQIPTPKFWREC